MLASMGVASLVMAVLSLLPCQAPFALVAFPLGVTTWLLAARDLASIGAGRGDPRGEPETRLAQERAASGAWLALLSASLWAGLFLLSNS
jgi:hypothetical protein